jgi:uncharacterized phage-associated protein
MPTKWCKTWSRSGKLGAGRFAKCSPFEVEMPFPATAVANEFLTIAKAEGKELTPLKLQKLVYFAHGWYLALTGQPLISETIQAWQYGPVIPTLYREFREYGNGTIGTPAVQSGFIGGRFTMSVPSLDSCGHSRDEIEKARQVIRKVWELYGGFSSVRLSNASHVPGGPWEKVYKEGHKSIPIPNDEIRTYFQGLAHATGR